MNRHDRRKAKAKAPPGFTTRANAVQHFLDGVLHNPADAPIVAISPVVWDISPQDGRRWYFLCACADATGEVHIDELIIGQDNRTLAEEIRGAVLGELVNRRPVVIHDFDDEQRFAGFCAATWPSDRTRKMHEEIKADYASRKPGDGA